MKKPAKARQPAASATARHAKAKLATPQSQTAASAGQLALFYDQVGAALFSLAVESRLQLRFSSANHNFLTAARMQRHEVVGKRIVDVIPEPSCTRVLKKCREAIRTGQTVRWEETYAEPAGTKYAEIAVTPVLDAAGRVTHLAGMVNDITKRRLARLALHESEERYRRIVQMAEEGIWTINAGSLTDYVNPKMAQMLGYAATEMLGRPISDFLDDEGRAMLVTLIKRRKGGIAEQFEFKYVRKDGSYLWAFVSTNPITNADGVYVGAMALLTDISARREAEVARRESEARFRAIFEQASIGVALMDTATGRFIDVNQRCCEIIGLSREQLTPTTFMDITHPADLPATMAHLQRLKAGLSRSYTLEQRNLLPDGTITWINLSVAAMWQPGELPTRHIAVVEDITERKRAEANYRRELEFNETLVNHTSAIIILLDHAGLIVHVNEPALQMLGYRQAELVGQPPPWDAGFMDLAEASRSRARLARLLTGADVPAREITLRGKDGTAYVVAISSIITRTPAGTIDRIIVTGTDLTERNRLQQELLRISELEQARIGHNLHDGVGQTMTGVASLMEALESELSGVQRSSAGRIRQLLQDAIQEVRRMSHSLSPAAVKNRGLGGVLQLLAETIRTNHRTACTCAIDPDIRLDNPEMETHIYRIAQEAANNALRHGSPKQIKLSLQRTSDHDCELTVADNGTGFSRKAGAGDGIGLRVMDYRANLIGGTLKTTSKPRKGVSVTCRFPCARTPTTLPPARP